jgi:hypothetical protein
MIYYPRNYVLFDCLLRKLVLLNRYRFDKTVYLKTNDVKLKFCSKTTMRLTIPFLKKLSQKVAYQSLRATAKQSRILVINGLLRRSAPRNDAILIYYCFIYNLLLFSVCFFKSTNFALLLTFFAPVRRSVLLRCIKNKAPLCESQKTCFYIRRSGTLRRTGEVRLLSSLPKFG